MPRRTRCRCGNCGRRGHNRRTCPQLEVITPPSPPPVEYDTAGERVVDMTQRPAEMGIDVVRVEPQGVDPTYVDRVIAGCTTHTQFYLRMMELDRNPTIAEELIWSRIKIENLRARNYVLEQSHRDH